MISYLYLKLSLFQSNNKTKMTDVIQLMECEVIKAIKYDEQKRWDKALLHYNNVTTQLKKLMKQKEYKWMQSVLQMKLSAYQERASDIRCVIGQNSFGAKRGQEISVNSIGETKNGETKTEEDLLLQRIQDIAQIERPSLKWSDISGLDDAKALLKEASVLPSRFPDLFNEHRRPWRGILFYGPPGTGKSMLARTLASELKSNCFLNVSSSNLVSKYQGESEQSLRALFTYAKSKAPSIIFIDEIDSLGTARKSEESESSRRIKTELLIQIDSILNHSSVNVLLIGCTNVPWELDEALKRRLEQRVLIPLPSPDDKRQLISILNHKRKTALTESQVKSLASVNQELKDYSGADIEQVFSKAMKLPLKELSKSQFFKLDQKTGKYQLPTSEELQHYTDTKQQKTNSTLQLKQPEIVIEQITLDEIPDNQIDPQILTPTFDQFLDCFEKSKASINTKDLHKFDSWTQQFGSIL